LTAVIRCSTLNGAGTVGRAISPCRSARHGPGERATANTIPEGQPFCIYSSMMAQLAALSIATATLRSAPRLCSPPHQLVKEPPIPLTQSEFCLSQAVSIRQQVQYREGPSYGDAAIDWEGHTGKPAHAQSTRDRRMCKADVTRMICTLAVVSSRSCSCRATDRADAVVGQLSGGRA
jgi:hypothetical protein